MTDLLRNLRDSAKPILPVAVAFMVGGLYPAVQGEQVNGVLIIMALLLIAVATAVLFRRPR